jgi:hypothetical protein
VVCVTFSLLSSCLSSLTALLPFSPPTAPPSDWRSYWYGRYHRDWYRYGVPSHWGGAFSFLLSFSFLSLSLLTLSFSLTSILSWLPLPPPTPTLSALPLLPPFPPPLFAGWRPRNYGGGGGGGGSTSAITVGGGGTRARVAVTSSAKARRRSTSTLLEVGVFFSSSVFVLPALISPFLSQYRRSLVLLSSPYPHILSRLSLKQAFVTFSFLFFPPVPFSFLRSKPPVALMRVVERVGAGLCNAATPFLLLSSISFVFLPREQRATQSVKKGSSVLWNRRLCRRRRVLLSPRRLSSIFPALFFSSRSQENALEKSKEGGPKQCYTSSHADGVLLLL